MSKLASEAVREYLQAHRDFLAEHPDLLMELNVPHADKGGAAVSLIERQVQLLRDRNFQSENQLHQLLSVARENDRLGESLHRLALGLLSVDGLQHIPALTRQRLLDDFRVEWVAVRVACHHDLPTHTPEWQSGEALQDLLALVKKRVQMGVELATTHKAALFGDDAGLIQSVALIPLQGERIFGLIALGSQDPERYNPRVGTLILERIGELVSAALETWMRKTP